MALVSVITPTWDRHGPLIRRCMASVSGQSYRHVEHVIVSDGPDPFLREAFELGLFPYNVKYYELEAHAPENGRWGTKARLLGIEKSAGEYVAYLDDDDRYREHHVAKLAAILDGNPLAGFCYGIGCFMSEDNTSNQVSAFGNGIPSHGQIGTGSIMNRRETLAVASWRDDGQQATIDWDLVERWLAAGVKWDYTPDADAGTEHIWRSGGHAVTAFR